MYDRTTGSLWTQFDGRPLSFRRTFDGFVDDATGSVWGILGTAVDGPLAGERLMPVIHDDTFLFSWTTFQVEAVLVEPAREG